MEFLLYPIAFIVSLGLLVAIHEYGHFWAARRIGVHVQRFSIGFGPVLKTVKDKWGTEFCISAFPLGGYVKLLDSRIEEVPASEIDKDFSRKSLMGRIFVYAAGPMVNLLFTLLVYWAFFMFGVVRLAPIVGEVIPQTDAAQAAIQVGDEILAIDGKVTKGWEEVTYALISRVGEQGEMRIEVAPKGSDLSIKKNVTLSGFQFAQDEDPLAAFGVKPAYQPVPPIMGEVMPDSAAELAGIKAGDEIVSVNGAVLETWQDLVEIITPSANQGLELKILRNQETILIRATPQAVETEAGETLGRLGVKPQPVKTDPNWYRTYQYGVVDAFFNAFKRTLDVIEVILVSIKKMIVGHISLDNLSGPITIAQVAGDTASYGLEPFLNFLAYLSVSLGVLNLLPIPMLDGGHILYALIEGIKGRPLSMKTQQRGMSIGVAIIATFMLLAFYNDIARLIG